MQTWIQPYGAKVSRFFSPEWTILDFQIEEKNLKQLQVLASQI